MFIVSSPYSQQLVFPTAEGYGKFAKGGREVPFMKSLILGTVKEVVFRSVKLSNNIHNPARRKLRMINNAGTINDLRIPGLRNLKVDSMDSTALESMTNGELHSVERIPCIRS